MYLLPLNLAGTFLWRGITLQYENDANEINYGGLFISMLE